MAKDDSLKEFEAIVIRVAAINRYLDLFKSCNSKLCRDIVLTNAKALLRREDYCLLLENCCELLLELYEKLINQDSKTDEPFIY
jgi:hypothetical protein